MDSNTFLTPKKRYQHVMYFIDQLLEENTQVEDFFFTTTKLRPFKQVIQISQNISHREFCYRFVKYTSQSRTTNDSWGLLTSSLRIQQNQTKRIAGESIHPDDILSSPRRIVEINFFERFKFFRRTSSKVDYVSQTTNRLLSLFT